MLGVSPDGVESHARFKHDFDLPFTLLADPTTPSRRPTASGQEKSRYGRTYLGIVRSTFVIDADGTVVKAMRNVKPATHADDVLAVLATLGARSGG